jgi:plasmid segregation protein ParM
VFRVGVDLGYGFVKAVSESGERALFPSVVGSGGPRALAGLFGEKRASEDRYHVVVRAFGAASGGSPAAEERFVGDLALRESPDASRAFSINRIDHPSTRMLLAVALGLLAGDRGPVHLGTGLPVQYYSGQQGQKEQFRRALEGFSADVEFLSPPLGKRRVSVGRATVFPQAAGAFFAQLLDESGRVRDPDLARGALVGVVDIGYKTVDLLVVNVEDGLSVQGGLSKTLDWGTSAVTRAVQRQIEADSGRVVGAVTVDAALHGSGVLCVWGTEYRVSEMAWEARREAARAIADHLELHWGDALGLMRRVYFAGGGAADLWEHLRRIHPAAQLVPDGQFANARGFLAVAAWAARRDRQGL